MIYIICDMWLHLFTFIILVYAPKHMLIKVKQLQFLLTSLNFYIIFIFRTL